MRHAQTEAASPSRTRYTHTPTKSFKQINGRRRQARNTGAEHMRRARHAEGSPRESGQGLTTPMPWPCSGLHAAQAPVRPRHCTQALLQQLDQFILSNTLPRPASSSVRLRRLPHLRILRLSTSRRRRRRRFAEGLWHHGPEM